MKPLVAIFAHPDDEAFGPSGALVLWARERDVHLICVTNGDAGQNSLNDSSELREIRKSELLNSAGIIGIKKVHFLEYKDGSLSNNKYHEVADKIDQILNKIQPDTLLTFDKLGISGHLDHIFVSLVTTYLAKRLPFIESLLYFGEKEAAIKEIREDYFIYMPDGFDSEQINYKVDVSQIWNTKIKAIKAHQSQSQDGEMIIKNLKKFPKTEYFIKVDTKDL